MPWISGELIQKSWQGRGAKARGWLNLELAGGGMAESVD
jgi:hypothetical protein